MRRRELEQAVLEAARRWYANDRRMHLPNDAELEDAVLLLLELEQHEGPAPSTQTVMLRCSSTVGRILEAVRDFRKARAALAELRRELVPPGEVEDIAGAMTHPDARILVDKIAAAATALEGEDLVLEGFEERDACAAVERALEGGL